ncbi:MAG: tRNA lysidine(34) synthetase TilS [Phycisphaerales bacterium]|nr:tRNA lysidine(34) synthetase TilS [Phycisphaerales bacterium]
MDTRRFHKLLFDAVGRLMPPDGIAVCAVSGGADSMAMLHGLCEVNRMRRCGWILHVAHLDHHLPHDSSAMMAFVKQTATSLNLCCFTDCADVPALSKETGESIEETGRKVRYTFLERVALEVGAQAVVLAHHADDQAETVLHRVLRGTGLRGLSGMPERRPIRDGSEIEIIRPMLSLRRADARSYLQRRGLSFMHDATNDDIHAATRNRIRHEILPRVGASINPDVMTALVRLSKQAGGAIDVIRDAAAERFAESRLRDDDDHKSVVLDVSALRDLPRAIQSEVVILALEHLSEGFKFIGSERIEAVTELISGDGKLRNIQLPGGAIVQRRGKRLCFLGSRRGSSITEASSLTRNVQS